MVTVLCVPLQHPYVGHLTALGSDRVVRVDGDLDHAISAGVAADPDAVDLVHVHVGLAPLDADRCLALLDLVRSRRLPLVVTVHDVPHPAHPDPADLGAALELLVPAADALVTLSVGTAREVLRRWGRTSHVLPHPHVLDIALVGRPMRPPGPPVVGMPAPVGDDPALGALIDAALEVVAAVPGARLRVDLTDAAAPHAAAPLADRLAALALAGHLDLRRHGPAVATDPAVYLRQVDVVLLHRQDASIATWLEACFDAGTPVLAPDPSWYVDRPGALTYEVDRPHTLAAALAAVLRGHPVRGATGEDRRSERELVALAHAELYASLLERP